jgi:hypothetical protein
MALVKPRLPGMLHIPGDALNGASQVDTDGHSPATAPPPRELQHRTEDEKEADPNLLQPETLLLTFI